MADESGSVEYSLWNNEFRTGDVMQLTGGYLSMFRGKPRLYSSKHSELTRLCHFRKLFSLQPCLSVPQH